MVDGRCGGDPRQASVNALIVNASRRARIRGVWAHLAFSTFSLLCLSGCQGTHNIANIWMRWIPNEAEFAVEGVAPKSVLTQAEWELVASTLKHGHVLVTGAIAQHSFGPLGAMLPQTRTIVVFTGPVTTTVRLPQAFGSTVLHVQDGQGFRHYPSQSSSSDYVIQLEPRDANSVSVWREVRGRRTGGGSMGLVQY